MRARRSASEPIVRTLGVPPQVLRHLAITDAQHYPVLFESVAAGPLGRFSVLAAWPRAALWLSSSGRIEGESITPQDGGFLDNLERWWRAERQSTGAAGGLPFSGGWAVFLSYELVQEIEPRLVLPASALPWHAFALRTPCALVHERATDRVLAIAEADQDDILQVLERDAHRAAAELNVNALGGGAGAALLNGLIHEEEPTLFLERVRRAQDYIRAGDIYQANLSRAWHIKMPGGPQSAAAGASAAVPELYARLCATNPAPFAALAQWRGVSVLSSSPERLIRLADDAVETRPIAGTRPRSRRPGDDAIEAAALIAHPKERAEHIMLIDLERNDLGRVCEAGTVRVDELMVTETYAHVHHIVSSVRGRLRPDVTPIGALRAVFPGGTITGCPKFRCMQIIAELEGEGRGAYTGSLGFLSRDGTMDLNILIRTMTVRGMEISLRAGAGIVADSIAERELEETRAKARGLLAAFETEWSRA
ncbi:MAG TPA: aminodeoxychorismate synthase component I [Steroidobacteraceae bacterium]|nr:aminodeoxychorismate synthase component I [Steroidobacteraceae bacterium]